MKLSALRNIFVAAVVFVTVSSVSVSAATVTLTWNQNPEPDIAGYYVVYGTSSGQYSATIDVGNATSFQFVEPDPSTRYFFAVSAYNASGVRSALSTEVSTSIVNTLAVTGVSANLPAPQRAGTSIVFSASVTGGVAPVQYKWRVFDGGTWSVAKNWSTSNTFTWTPTVGNANYSVSVWARGATSTADAPESSMTVAYPISQVPLALALTSLSASVPSPQPLGASIRFTASGTGGTSPYQYKWLVSNGGGWIVAQNWSTTNAFTWTPTAASANYSIGVWMRSATSTTDAAENTNAGSSISFAITSGTVSVTSLTANKPAPQLTSSKIQFSATASGASAIRYQWSVFDGVRWSTVQDWSISNRFWWTPAVPNAQYQVQVRAQNAANTADTAGASMLFPIGTAVRGNGRR